MYLCVRRGDGKPGQERLICGIAENELGKTGLKCGMAMNEPGQGKKAVRHGA